MSKITRYAEYFNDVKNIEDILKLISERGWSIEENAEFSKGKIAVADQTMKTIKFSKKADEYKFFYLLHEFYHLIESENAEYNENSPIENADIFAIIMLNKMIEKNNNGKKINELLPDSVLMKIFNDVEK